MQKISPENRKEFHEFLKELRRSLIQGREEMEVSPARSPAMVGKQGKKVTIKK